MKNPLPVCILLLISMGIFVAGCMEPPVQEPVVSVGDIAVSDVSLQTITVNTTVSIYNPNPVAGKINKIAFDLYYLDDTKNYLGHGEQSALDLPKDGNTTVTIPVSIGNVQALKALGSLVRTGSITLNVNGSAFIDIKAMSFEKHFEQSKEFKARDLESLMPVTAIPGTSINVTEKIQQLRGLLDLVKG
jgi:LEA14-like dessication related protein